MSSEQRDHPPYSVDVIVLTPREDTLALLLERSSSPGGWSVPWAAPAGDETLDGVAHQIAQRVAGTDPAWIEQIGAFGDRTSHPSGADISVAFVALVPLGASSREGEDFAWSEVGDLPQLLERQRIMVQHGVSLVRDRMDLSPVAFRLLPPNFTLSELQQMYELLLGKRLHKASFRRALQAAWLVEPTEEWRSEGRGRPAQLYRYAPKKRRKGRRGVRFDLLTP